METIDIPAQTHPWSTVLEVARHFTADEWLLTGGLMVQAHAMLHRLPARPTTDADFLLDILAYDRIASQMRSFLCVMGYELEEDTITEYATRLTTKSEHKVDLMVTDYLYGKAKRENATLAVKRLCGMPGGGQAIRRSSHILIRYRDETAGIRIPDLLGAVMLKSAAWAVDKTNRRDRHLADAALLLSLIDDPDEQVERLHSRNDRKRILRLHEMLTEDSEYWQVLDDVHRQNGIDVLDTLTDWAEKPVDS